MQRAPLLERCQLYCHEPCYHLPEGNPSLPALARETLQRDAGMLVAPVPKLVEPSLGQQMFTFMEPFTLRLWAVIALQCVVSGAVLYAVEYNSKRNEDYTEASNHVQGTAVWMGAG